jgi:hypothetical protein
LLQITLHPLHAEQAGQIVAGLAGESVLNEALRHRIIAQADGIPLFIEELTKTLLEQPVDQNAAGPNPEIPATLRDSLVARLDHLGPAKETAQWAAVLGREFSYPILQACSPYDEQRLQSDLARLIEAELVLPAQAALQDATLFIPAPTARSTPLRYTFKHSLVQEAAYASLLKRTRQVYHRRIAEALESRFPQMIEMRPEVLAQHYAGAGMPAKAVGYWQRAGERAAAQGATLEARTFFDRALEGIAPEDREQRWQVLQRREVVLDFRGEREAQGADLAALLELAEAFDDNTRRAHVYLRKTTYAAVKGDYQATLPLAEAARAAARQAGDLSLELRALAYLAQSLTFFKEMDKARQAVEEILAQVERSADDSTRALGLTVAAFYYLESGDLVRAVQLQGQSANAAQRAGNLVLELQINANLGLLYTTLGLYEQARTTLEAVQARAELAGDRRIEASNLRHLGYVYWCSGDRDLGLKLEEQALKGLTATGDTYGKAACLGNIGYIQQDAGNLALAAEYLAQARRGFAEMGMDPDRFEAQAVEARVALAEGRLEEACRLATEVWNYLREMGTEGISSPARIYVCIAEILEAVEIPGMSSNDVIAAGYHTVMQNAEKISNQAWRRSFLENVAENRVIIQKWENK